MQCPVNCLYCMAMKIDSRSKYWNVGARIGMNKSCTFINRLPQDPPLKNLGIPWQFLDGEYLGFQGITDCFWSVYKEDLRWLVQKVSASTIKKLVLTTKIPITKDQRSLLHLIKNRLLIVYSVTGLDSLERIKTSERIQAIRDCKEDGIDVLPLIHPYIHQASDLSFLKDLQDIGIQEISWKGFRYNPHTMKELSKHIPEEILSPYNKGTEEEVMLGESYLQTLAEEHGMKYVPLREYIQRPNGQAGISRELATWEVNNLARQVVFSSSEKDKSAILQVAIERRL